MIRRKIKFNEVIFRTDDDEEKTTILYGRQTPGAILDGLVDQYGEVTLIKINTYEKMYEVSEPDFIKISKEIN